MLADPRERILERAERHRLALRHRRALSLQLVAAERHGLARLVLLVVLAV